MMKPPLEADAGTVAQIVERLRRRADIEDSPLPDTEESDVAMREIVGLLRQAADLLAAPRGEAAECESECNPFVGEDGVKLCAGGEPCNPYVASCGAKFCTYEEMSAHRCVSGLPVAPKGRACLKCGASWKGSRHVPTTCPECGETATVPAPEESTAGPQADDFTAPNAEPSPNADVTAMAHGGAGLRADGRALPDVAPLSVEAREQAIRLTAEAATLRGKVALCSDKICARCDVFRTKADEADAKARALLNLQPTTGGQ